jgi:hypothetical protein
MKLLWWLLLCRLYIVFALKTINNWMAMLVTLFLSVIVFALATQTWDKAYHRDGARVEVFAFVNLQISLLCLQIVIIVALVAVSYGDSALVLDRKVQGIKWSVSSSLLRLLWLAWVAVDVTYLDCCLPRSCLLVEMTWITCIKKLETCVRESEPHHTRRKVTVMSLERNHTCVS